MKKSTETNRRINLRIQELALQSIDPRTENTRKCLNELIELVIPKLKFYIWRYVQEESDVEDVLFNALEKIYVNMHTYNPNFQFTTWCFTIAHNEALAWKNNTPAARTNGMYDIDTMYDSDMLSDMVDDTDDLIEADRLLNLLRTELVMTRSQMIESISLMNMEECDSDIKYNEAMEMLIDKINHMKVSGIADSYGICDNTAKTKLLYMRKLIGAIIKGRNEEINMIYSK